MLKLKFWIVLSVLFLSLSSAAQDADYKTFQGMGGYTVNYPSSWVASKEGFESIVSPEQLVIYFFYTYTDEKAFSSSKTLEEFKTKEKTIDLGTIVNKQLLQKNPIEDVKRESIKIAGVDGEVLTYKSAGMYSRMYMFIDGPILYQLGCGGAKSEKDLKVFDKIVDSFKSILRARAYDLISQSLANNALYKVKE